MGDLSRPNHSDCIFNANNSLQIEVVTSLKVIEAKIDNQTKKFDEITDALKLKATKIETDMITSRLDKQEDHLKKQDARIEDISVVLAENKGERLATRAIQVSTFAICGLILSAAGIFVHWYVGAG
jgi:hypothetical protein